MASSELGGKEIYFLRKFVNDGRSDQKHEQEEVHSEEERNQYK